MPSDNTYDLKPSKEAYQAVKADVTPVSAIEELIDNALDNWQRTSQKLDDLRIDIEHVEADDPEDEAIIIRDNSGGVPEEDVSMLFALGQSAKDQITGSIGAYGIGAKKAILNLGNKAVMKSRELHSDSGFGFMIDQGWLEDEDDWTVDKEEYTDIDEGVTEIRISQLNANWDDFVDDLYKKLGKTYRFFLNGDRLTQIGDLDIYVEDEIVTSPEGTDWSYLPLDGFHPRRYEGIEIDSRDLTDTVYVDVEVGLLQKADDSVAGAEIYCQDRQVLDRVRDERAGFKTGSGSSRLGAFSGQHRRLKVVIEFYTEGDARELPWDAQKSDIDRYHKVTQAALDWVRRIVKPYHELAGDYDTLPTTFVRPYGPDHPHARDTELHDYSGGRERVTHKPNSRHDDCHAITEQVEKTEPLKLRNYGNLDEKLHAAYDEELTRRLHEEADFEVNLEDIEVVDDISDAGQADIAAVTSDLERQAERDIQAQRRFTDLPEWQQPAYEWYLKVFLDKREVGGEEEELTFSDLKEVTADEVEEELQVGVNIKESSSEEEKEETSEDGNEDDSQAEIEEKDDKSSEGETEESRESGLTEFETGAGDSQTDTTVTTLGTDSSTEEETTDEESGTQLERIDENVHYIPIPDDQWDETREALNLGEDATEEEVVDALLQKLSLLRQLTA